MYTNIGTNTHLGGWKVETLSPAQGRHASPNLCGQGWGSFQGRWDGCHGSSEGKGWFVGKPYVSDLFSNHTHKRDILAALGMSSRVKDQRGCAPEVLGLEGAPSCGSMWRTTEPDHRQVSVHEDRAGWKHKPDEIKSHPDLLHTQLPTTIPGTRQAVCGCRCPSGLPGTLIL